MATNTLTHGRLKFLLDYDPMTGNFTWRVTRSTVKQGALAGTIDPKGYRRISLDAKVYLAHRLAWLWVYGEWPANELDHVNRNPADNRIENLRLATRQLNTQNTTLRVDNRSGHRGVGWHKPSQKWRARIQANNKLLELGYFDSLADAICAYEKAAAQHHVRHTELTH